MNKMLSVDNVSTIFFRHITCIKQILFCVLILQLSLEVKMNFFSSFNQFQYINTHHHIYLLLLILHRVAGACPNILRWRKGIFSKRRQFFAGLTYGKFQRGLDLGSNQEPSCCEETVLTAINWHNGFEITQTRTDRRPSASIKEILF